VKRCLSSANDHDSLLALSSSLTRSLRKKHVSTSRFYRKHNMILTNYTEQSPSWEANSHSANQEISRLLRNLKLHQRVHKRPALVSVLSQMHPDHKLKSNSLKPISIVSSHVRLDFPCGFFPSGFPTKTVYEFLISSLRATCPSISSSLIQSPWEYTILWSVRIMKLPM
jgi:hypothetical protein